MSDHWIINDALFGKIKHSILDGESIKQFIDDVIYKHPNWSILLKELSDIYVLVASHSAQTLLQDGEKSWKDFMNEEQYKMLETNGRLVIAYMLVNEKHEDIHYIELFDTVVRHNDFGRIMINRYEKERDFRVTLIPQEIIQSSAKYWAKVLDLYDYDHDGYKKCIDKEAIDEFIKENNLNSGELKWKYLYELCNEKL
tara:strand:- start:131 stop:724 length:594 start_codon:yes stop_codon:yes gene_type:complete